MPRYRNPNAPYWKTLEQAERSMIEYALDQAGSIKEAARLLGVVPDHLSRRCVALGVKKIPDRLVQQKAMEWRDRAEAAEAKLRDAAKKAAKPAKVAAPPPAPTSIPDPQPADKLQKPKLVVVRKEDEK